MLLPVCASAPGDEVEGDGAVGLGVVLGPLVGVPVAVAVAVAVGVGVGVVVTEGVAVGVGVGVGPRVVPGGGWVERAQAAVPPLLTSTLEEPTKVCFPEVFQSAPLVR